MCKYRKKWHALGEILAKGFINIYRHSYYNNIYPISVSLSEGKHDGLFCRCDKCDRLINRNESDSFK